jgi:hypothetical protein
MGECLESPTSWSRISNGNWNDQEKEERRETGGGMTGMVRRRTDGNKAVGEQIVGSGLR